MNTNFGSDSEWTPDRVSALTRNIAIVIGGGILLGVFAAWANLYYVGAVVAGAALVILVAWQFEAALVLYALVAFVPWGKTPDIAVGGSGVGKGVYVSEIMLGFLLVVWVGKYLLSSLPRERIRSGFHIPIILYLAYTVLNVAHSFIFWDPHVNKLYQYVHVNFIELAFRFLSAGAFIMMATTVGSRKWLKWTTIFLLVPGIYNLANGLIGSGIPVSAPWWPLVSILPVCYAWAITLDPEKSLPKRIACAIFTAIAIYVILIRGMAWVSGWLGLLTGLLVVTLIMSRKVFAAGLAALAVAAILFLPYVNEKVVAESKAGGDYDRFALLRGSLRYATTFPLGVGVGNYRSYNSFYYGNKWGTMAYSSAHGTYAQHLSEMGIPGLVLLALILISGGRWLYRGYSKTRAGPSGAYMLAALGQLAGIAVASFIGDYIIPTYHNGGIQTFSATVYSWIIWGVAVAHVRVSASEQANSTLNTQHSTLDIHGPIHIDR